MPQNSNKVTRTGVYPLADWYGKGLPRNIRAQWTGEKRAPRKGEWYLSGAIVEAYLAPSTLSPSMHIAKLVRVEVQTITHVIGDYIP